MRYPNSLSCLLPALGLSLLLLPGCYSRSDIKEEGGKAGTMTEAVVGDGPDASSAASETAATDQPLQRVNVLLEVSGSMEGFMPKTAADGGNTRFQQQVAQFLSEVNRMPAVKQKSFFLLKDKPYAESYAAMSTTVRAGIRQPAKSTELPAVLDTLMTRYYQPGTVNVLISDFIYSPKNTGAIPYIKTDITDALQRNGAQSDLAVSVYGFTSDFRGTYYPALVAGGKKANCCDTDIPYYYWVIGPTNAVRQFDAALLTAETARQAHFGVTYPRPAYSVLDKFENQGSWYYGDAGASKRAADSYRVVAISEASAQQPVEFVVGLDLQNLPAQYRELAYLQQNLQVQTVDTDAKLLGVTAATAQTRGSSGPQSRFTHFAKLRLTKVPPASRPLVLRLQNQRPAWVSQWTTKNDAVPAAKTFALSGLLDGLQASVPAQPTIFELPLTLQPAK
ncbi:hypothetical protein [Hymenobacter psychrophilus]|uniref:Uncharacterized protein n=1 Tax=Hymenobacter psychrophilus TaxID=651662 RepID=A0A1H3JN41_9BACT|nr:hypothetical protein [Hymenobacter psychrophilus]SDY40798.1 hypothetical protein SAMN04488069_108135 [Hymenobacter psychrophilus]